MKKYVRKIKLRDRPYDNSVSINTREGGTYHSMYAKPLQKLVLGQVALQHAPSLDVPCSVVNSERKVVLQGSILNTYLLSEYSLRYSLGDISTEIRIGQNNTWIIELDPKDLYNNSYFEMSVTLSGLDLDGGFVEVINKVSINLGSFCEPLICNDAADKAEFLFTYDKDSALFFNIELFDGTDNKRTSTLSTHEFVQFLTNNKLEVEIWSKDDAEINP